MSQTPNQRDIMILFNITSDIIALSELLIEASDTNGEVKDEMAQAAFDKFFAEIGEAEGEKLEGYARMIRSLEALADAAQVEIDDYTKKRQAWQKAAHRMMDRVGQHLDATQRTEVKTTTGRVFKWHKNGGKAPLDIDEVVYPAENAPLEFQRHKIEYHLKAVEDALKAGRVLEFAQFGERGRHMRLK